MGEINMKNVLCYCTIILFLTAGNVAANGSIQAFGSWWDSADADTSYGGGLRGTFGQEVAVDIAWTYFTGDDITVDIGGKEETLEFGGLDSHVFDLGIRYTFPMEIYLGGGGSYYTFDTDVGSTDGKWGLYGLIGWSFGGERFRGFIEGIYRYTEATVELDTAGDYDISYDGIGANIGIMYRF